MTAKQRRTETATAVAAQKAIKNAHAAEKAALAAIEKAFPVGTKVHWYHGRHPQSGEVATPFAAFSLAHSRLNVVSDKTGVMHRVSPFQALKHR